jgi:hypothetical protein
MTGTGTRFSYIIRQIGICVCMAAALGANVRSIRATVVISDGFGDADRNNDGQITFYDTDINDSGTWNDPTLDAGLISRNITEVTAAQDPTDVGIVWSGIRSYDTAANLVKSRLRIINDSVPTGVETAADIHNHGLALGIESRGSGSSFMGRFGQSIALGANAGDKVVVSFDWRVWRESANNDSQPGLNNSFRWGIYQDTDNQLGQSGPFGSSGASVVWGKDDGNFYASSPGAKGDKGINTELPFGSAAPTTNARIRWEYNTTNATITDNGKILEGTGATDTLPSIGDTATIAAPTANGPGGVITDLSSFAPHNLKLEIVRLDNGLVEVATFVDNVELLRDAIKTTDTGYNTLQPVPFTYDYVAFRTGGTANTDCDYVIDNFKVETFTVGVAGDYNGDGKVDAADYVIWRKNPGGFGGDPAGYNAWRASFGNPPGSGASLSGTAVPEPASAVLFLVSGLLAIAFTARSAGRPALCQSRCEL